MLVILLANAVCSPGTVVVHLGDATGTIFTMSDSRRLGKIANLTKSSLRDRISIKLGVDVDSSFIMSL